MIESVKVGYVDSSMASKGARTLSVKVSSSRSFETPTRPISTTELTAKSFLGYRGEISSPIAALPVDLKTGGKYQKFLKNNGVVNDTRRKLQSMSDSTFMCPSFPILQLPALKLDDKRPFKIAFDMQCSVEDMDYINIPPIDSGHRAFERMIVDWCQSAEDNYDKGAVPQLRMDEAPVIFSKKLDVLCDLSRSGMITIVNMIYANPYTNSLQYAELWGRRNDMCAIVNCSEVPAKGDHEYMTGVNSDLEDYLIQHGMDSITRKKHSVSPKFMYMRNMEEPPADLDGIDEFDVAVHHASIRVSKDLWKATSHPLMCDCSVCRGNTRDEIVDRFAYKDDGQIERSWLRYYSNMHDHQSDQSELERMRSYIRTDEMSEYEKQVETDRNDLLRKL
ncbi:hypothetical protein Mpt1_c10180 [Candidatus Methanoplasma termitum]|uniref:Uncharacterized protein n=1 Tax=Candidatus Methanoplasma termitum TaxID=1577791 RepID=A0A0A7LCI4_9ARCH|nr:hypothetical protein [Candidatus Methanoplasma termitum]AIZ56890.1 hypothetical protein Mpt1_c10180 [Candidatus Methanoplasma termitum]